MERKLVKFIYSEKATKVCKISQNFVAFSEYMNFIELVGMPILKNCPTEATALPFATLIVLKAFEM